MFRVKIPVKPTSTFCLIVVAATLSIGYAGCGSSSNTLSQAQAQAVSQQISLALGQALTGAIASNAVSERTVHLSLATVVNNLRPDQSSSCTPTSSGENCTISDTVACSGSGTITVAGDVDETLNNGSGSVQTQITITPANCAVSNLVINGDPSITVDSQISFTGSAPSYPITFAEKGGISYGPKPSGSCQFNVSSSITSATTCTVTGTVCGQSVSGSC
ncbi:MAG: hypothetical protein ACLPHP_18945 [Candidatus Sulfotelmatobacter sp.]